MTEIGTLERPSAEATTTIDTFHNYVDGAWVASRTARTFENVNPADTSDIVGRFASSAAADAEEAVRAASTAFKTWKNTSVSTRTKILNAAAAYLESHADRFAQEMTREQGKPVNLSKDEILRSAQTLRFYAVEGQSLTGEVFPNDDAAMTVYTQREPLGVVSVITPWNFPVSIPARKIAPALVTGNTVVFKPSSDAPLSGLRLTEAFAAAGLPKGVLNFVTGDAGAVGTAITASPIIRAISFTGSTAAGEHIHRNVPLTTRTQMELGGKNPLIVMEDADLDKAVELTVKGGLSLSGQACTGTSRVLVMREVKAEFTRKLIAKVKALKIGSGIDSRGRYRAVGDGAATRDRVALHRHRQARGEAAVGRGTRHRPRIRSRLLRVAGGLYRGDPGDAHRAGGDLRSGDRDHRSCRLCRRARQGQ